MLKVKIQPREIYQRTEELGLENSANMLTEIIEKGKDNTKRREAIKYLGLISNNSLKLKKECYGLFENLLISDDIIDIKCEAAKALGRIKDQKALKPLKWVLEQEPINNEMKLSVLKAIKNIGKIPGLIVPPQDKMVKKTGTRELRYVCKKKNVLWLEFDSLANHLLPHTIVDPITNIPVNMPTEYTSMEENREE